MMISKCKPDIWRSSLMLLLLVGHASAQETQQTPEGAQRFLGVLAKQHPVWLYPGLNNNAGSIDASFRLTDVVSDGKCATRLVGMPHIFNGTDDTGAFSSGPSATYEKGGHENLARLEAALAKWSVKGLPYSIDWARVSSVKQANRHKAEHLQSYVYPTKLLVQLSTADATFAFILPSEEIATRVAYAMEFLRLSCDMTADTGF